MRPGFGLLSDPRHLLWTLSLMGPTLATAQLAPSLGVGSGLPGASLSTPGVPSPPALEGARRGSAEGGLRLTVKMGATATVIYSSNPRLSTNTAAAASASAEGNTATTALQLAPTLSVVFRGPLLSGSANYAANAVSLLDGSDDVQIRHNLRSAARLNVIDERVAIDGSAQFTQQSASPLGTPAVGGGLLSSGVPTGVGNLSNLLSSNQVDLLSVQLSPVVQTRVAGLADAQLRYVHTLVERRGSDLPDDGASRQEAQAVQAVLSGGERLQWSVQALEQRQAFANGRVVEANRTVASLAYPVLPELTLRVGGGVERQNLQSDVATGATPRSSSVSQGGFTWTPSARTQVAVDVAERFFGTAWQGSVSHRLSRFSLRLTGSRASTDGPLSVSSAPGATESTVNVAQLYSQLLATAEPDPARRQDLLDRALRVRGLNGDSTVTGLAPTFSPSLQNRLELGLAYVMPRQTFSLLGARTETERILRDPLSPNDELARFGGLQQTILQAGLTHRLTPESSLGLTWSRLTTDASIGSAQQQLQQWQLNGSFRLGSRLTGVVLLRDAELRSTAVASDLSLTPVVRRDTTAAFILIPQL